MYKLQFINAYTQDLLREVSYSDVERIKTMMNTLSDNQKEIILFDNQTRTLKANYVSHRIDNDDESTTYKVFFKVKLHELQVPIKI